MYQICLLVYFLFSRSMHSVTEFLDAKPTLELSVSICLLVWNQNLSGSVTYLYIYWSSFNNLSDFATIKPIRLVFIWIYCLRYLILDNVTCCHVSGCSQSVQHWNKIHKVNTEPWTFKYYNQMLLASWQYTWPEYSFTWMHSSFIKFHHFFHAAEKIIFISNHTHLHLHEFSSWVT